MTSEALSAVYVRTSEFEGRVAHLYRDSAIRGNATCGVGHMVASFLACQSLPFQPAISEGEWAALQSMPSGLVASAYSGVTQGRLSEQAMDDLLAQDIGALLESLRVAFPEFDSFPDGPSAAVVDCAYNLGLTGLVRGFPKLTAAIRLQDWATAAQECHRQGISDERNAVTASLFSD